MPTVISSEIPLPMDRSVISSPSHISTIEPPVRAAIITTHCMSEVWAVISPSPPILRGFLADKIDRADGLDDGQRESQHTGVLVDALAAVLALFVHSFQLGDGLGEQLHDNAGVDVRAQADQHDGEVGQRAAGQDVQKAEQLVGVGLL